MKDNQIAIFSQITQLPKDDVRNFLSIEQIRFTGSVDIFPMFRKGVTYRFFVNDKPIIIYKDKKSISVDSQQLADLLEMTMEEYLAMPKTLDNIFFFKLMDLLKDAIAKRQNHVSF